MTHEDGPHTTWTDNTQKIRKYTTASCCGIEYFVETQILQAVYDSPMARVTRLGVCLVKDLVGDSPLRTSLYQGEPGDDN